MCIAIFLYDTCPAPISPPIPRQNVMPPHFPQICPPPKKNKGPSVGVFLAPYLCSALVKFNSVSTKGKKRWSNSPQEKNGGPIRPMIKNGGPIRPRSSEHLTSFTFFNIFIIPYTSIKKLTTVLNKEIKNKTFLKSQKRQKSPIMCYLMELCSAIYFVIFSRPLLCKGGLNI